MIVFLAIPGPGNLAIITATSKGRLAGGLAATAGVIAGDQVLMWLAAAGLAKLLISNPAVFSLVQYAGAIYLVYLGFRMVIAKPGDAPILRMQPRHFLRQGMLITLLNPIEVLFPIPTWCNWTLLSFKQNAFSTAFIRTRSSII